MAVISCKLVRNFPCKVRRAHHYSSSELAGLGGAYARRYTAKVTGRMGAPRTLLCLAFLTACSSVGVGATSSLNAPISAEKKIQLFDGVTMHVPTAETNGTENKLVSFKIDTKRSIEQGRGKQKKLMERILPMFIMPFLIQSTIVPMFLSMLKFMLFKSMMVGKLALALIIFNAFRNHNTFKGRQDEQMASAHYGYHGDMEEYGAYVN